jgi:hypothetical protein
MAAAKGGGSGGRARSGGSGGSRKAPAKAAGKTQTMKAPGKKPITFAKGGLHQSLGVPQGQPIPAAKMASALAGKEGPTAQKQAQFAKNVLGAGQKTAARNCGRKKGS